MVGDHTPNFSTTSFHMPMMLKKMTSTKYLDAIKVVIGNLNGVVDTVRNLQCEKILKLFRRAKE